MQKDDIIRACDQTKAELSRQIESFRTEKAAVQRGWAECKHLLAECQGKLAQSRGELLAIRRELRLQQSTASARNLKAFGAWKAEWNDETDTDERIATSARHLARQAYRDATEFADAALEEPRRPASGASGRKRAQFASATPERVGADGGGDNAAADELKYGDVHMERERTAPVESEQKRESGFISIPLHLSEEAVEAEEANSVGDALRDTKSTATSNSSSRPHRVTHQRLTSTMVDLDMDRASVTIEPSLLGSRRRIEEERQLREMKGDETRRSKAAERPYTPAFSDDLGPASPLPQSARAMASPVPVMPLTIESEQMEEFIVEEVHQAPQEPDAPGPDGSARPPAISRRTSMSARPQPLQYVAPQTPAAAAAGSGAAHSTAHAAGHVPGHGHGHGHGHGGGASAAMSEELSALRSRVVALEKENEQLSGVISQLRVDLLSLASKSSAAKAVVALRAHNEALSTHSQEVTERLKKATEHNAILMQKTDALTQQILELQAALNDPSLPMPAAAAGGPVELGGAVASGVGVDDAELKFLRHYTTELNESVSALKKDLHAHKNDALRRDAHMVGRCDALLKENKRLEAALRESDSERRKVEEALRAEEKSRKEDDERQKAEWATMREMESELVRLKSEREKLLEISNMLKSDLARVVSISNKQDFNQAIGNDERPFDLLTADARFGTGAPPEPRAKAKQHDERAQPRAGGVRKLEASAVYRPSGADDKRSVSVQSQGMHATATGRSHPALRERDTSPPERDTDDSFHASSDLPPPDAHGTDTSAADPQWQRTPWDEEAHDAERGLSLRVRASDRMTDGQRAALQKLKKRRDDVNRKASNAIQVRLQAVARIKNARQTHSQTQQQ
jgi:flagellar biosynthesis/type III secretory pathway chaperone